jgi:YHS domain-containing protein
MVSELAAVSSPICPYCSCSLIRLGITRVEATRWNYQGEELHFCCEGCLQGFKSDPDRYLAEVRGWIVCPVCLGEKPRELAVSIPHEGRSVYLCRCPHCAERFEKDAERLLQRLSG